MAISINTLSEKIQDELKLAYNTYSKEEPYSVDELEVTTLKLQNNYINTDKASRGNTLVPYDKCTWNRVNYRRGQYGIDYKWPEDDFAKDVSFPNILKAGTIIDRLGGTYGGYVCPCGEKVFSVSERAIPYYFLESELESEPSYHRYRVVKDITKQTIMESLNNFPSEIIPDGAKRTITNTLSRSGDNWLKFGTVAQVNDFGKQGIGGGKQYYSVVSVKTLIDLGFIEEIEVKEAVS